MELRRFFVSERLTFNVTNYIRDYRLRLSK